jgi:hypothetical protein
VRRAEQADYSRNFGLKNKNRTLRTVHELSMSRRAGFLTLVQPSSLICAQDAARGVPRRWSASAFCFANLVVFAPPRTALARCFSNLVNRLFCKSDAVKNS